MHRLFQYSLAALCSFVLALAVSAGAQAEGAQVGIEQLGSGKQAPMLMAIERLASSGEARALTVLEALRDGALRIDSAGRVHIRAQDGSLRDAASGKPSAAAGRTTTPTMDNKLRRVLSRAIASLSLLVDDPKIRLTSARELSKGASNDLEPVMRKALKQEQDGEIRELLEIALARIDLGSDSVPRRLAALSTIERTAEVSFKPELEQLTAKLADGSFQEQNEAIRKAAAAALSTIETKVFLVSIVGHVFYGLSLGSVLLLAALGLAVTFGLMRVINMAHGEMLMIGAYTTFTVQNFFQRTWPAHADLYLLAAVPCAFAVSFLVGVVLERSVIRFLYGRPLETLLATWGISLLLIQTVRLLYGAQNVTVANPSWLSGGFELLPNVVITYSRLAVIAFSVVVVTFVWFLMQKTSLGLQVRAVTQNRSMAAAVGIATRRVDMVTFGFGSGIAGLGGVALSQLGNVGPELGQSYIVDSFMVVVLGGVGKLAGAIAGALGLGVVSKFLEPAAGAVLAKIFILAFVILFIQKRPQGMFALKGRAAEVT
ncbi:MAG TPA: urea ABC transporter permease subunit UrtB [Polyangiaceae bacterium]